MHDQSKFSIKSTIFVGNLLTWFGSYISKSHGIKKWYLGKAQIELIVDLAKILDQTEYYQHRHAWTLVPKIHYADTAFYFSTVP